MGAIDFSINENLLKFFSTQLGHTCFVETGTFRGDSLSIAAQHFAECHSVELSQEYHAKALERFQSTPNVKLHHGSSPEVLTRLAPTLCTKPCLYWLDAHWCVAENTAGENSQSPLIRELQAINPLHPGSVVLVDDARLYLCAPPQPHRYQDWPGFAEIVRLLAALSATHTFSVYNDVIAYYPQSCAKEFDRFAYDNGVDWLNLVLNERNLQAERNRPKPKRNLWQRLLRRRASR